MTLKLWGVLGAAAAVATLFAGPVAAQDVIRIGVTQPLTGAFV